MLFQANRPRIMLASVLLVFLFGITINKAADEQDAQVGDLKTLMLNSYLANTNYSCSGPSMEPTLHSNNILITERISPRFQRIGRVFHVFATTFPQRCNVVDQDAISPLKRKIRTIQS
ncbi:hypothetical protein Bhyg_06217, partial [Pseudolycoriella hygida]